MKNILLFALLSTFAISAQATNSSYLEQVCGVVQVAHHDGEIKLNLADRRDRVGKQTNYKILNPYDFDWFSGSCLCVSGTVTLDPEDETGDGLNNLIQGAKKLSEDFSGKSCRPVKI